MRSTARRIDCTDGRNELTFSPSAAFCWPMPTDWTIRDKPIVAIGLLTADDLQTLGSSFQMAWPVDQAPCFEGLLQAIDEADRAIWRERDRRDERAKPEDA